MILLVDRAVHLTARLVQPVHYTVGRSGLTNLHLTARLVQLVHYNVGRSGLTNLHLTARLVQPVHYNVGRSGLTNLKRTHGISVSLSLEGLDCLDLFRQKRLASA